jgi:PEP-CTERM motif
MYLLRSLFTAGALALAPALANGQLPVSTGTQVTGSGTNTRDTRWQVGFAAGALPTTFNDAFRILNPVWGLPSDASWIGAEGGTGTQPGASGDGSRRYTYAARTSFSLNAGDQLTIRMQCTFDNYWLGLFINGTQFGGSVCGPDLTYALGTEFTIGPSAFTAGNNILEFRWQGDGVTDGFVARINSAVVEPGNPGQPGVVPEPSTYLLMATGMVGLVGVARRRRQG